MSFNFSSLQEKANQVIHNADEAIKKWVDFIQAPAGDVSFQYYDKNGNLQTATFPNRNKVVNDFIANVNSAMTKTFYVDAVNGSDLNDGSSNAPFATLKKAINSIPTGGWGFIYVKSDLTFDHDAWKDNITAIIVRDPSLTTAPVISNVNNASRILTGNNSRLWFADVDFNLTFTGVNIGITLFMWNTHAYRGDASFSMGGGLGLYNCNVTINTDSNHVTYLSVSIPYVRLIRTNITFSNTSTGSFYIADAKSCKAIELDNVSLTENGTSVDPATKIVNIVRDTNGVPRNILANVVL